MHSTSLPLSCNLDQFSSIYNNLSLHGNKGHEDIEMVITDNHFHPQTCSKKGFFHFSDNLKTYTCLVEFFEKNIPHLAKQPAPHELMRKFKSLCKVHESLKTRFRSLQETILKMQAMLAAEEKYNQIIQNAILESQHLQQKAELACKQKEEEAERNIEAKAKQLNYLTQEIHKIQDTLLVCKDDQISGHMASLAKICFFNISQSHIRVMKKSSLAEHEAKEYKYKYEFPQFKTQTLFRLLQWLNDNTSLADVVEFHALSELYELADYLNDEAFSKACLAQFKLHLNEEGRFFLLAHAKYEVHDSLIQHCCDFVIENRLKLTKDARLGKIQPAYFMAIAPKLKGPTSYELLITWAEAQSKKNNTTLSNIFYQHINKQQLITYLNLKTVSPQTYISKILPKNILKSSEEQKWLRFYLQEFIDTNSPDFHVYNIDECTTKIWWNIPIAKLSEAKDPHQDATCSTKFRIKNIKFDLFFGKMENPIKFVFGVCAYTENLQMTTLINVKKLKFESDNPVVDKTDMWGCEEGGQTNHIAYLTEQEVQNSIDINKGYLPIRVKINLSKYEPVEESSESIETPEEDASEEEASVENQSADSTSASSDEEESSADK